MKADMRTRRFGTNVHKDNGFNVLKTAAIYGPNNSGKTCLINIIRCIKDIILNKPTIVYSNFFNREDNVSRLGVSFISDGHMYSYDFAVMQNAQGEHVYPYERFAEIRKDKAGRDSAEVWFERDVENHKFFSSDEKFSNVMEILGYNNILMHVANIEQVESLKKVKEILTSFAGKIEIIDNRQPGLAMPSKTLSMLKENSGRSVEIRDFIKNADLYMDDIKYDESSRFAQMESSKTLDADWNELLKLTSYYKGFSLPSILWDSDGTKRMEFLAGYIVEALHAEKILIIDELDTSLHFKLTRAIVSAFNSDVNIGSQLIFSTHDVSLLDCRKLFRKEQIWFINKDDSRVYLYPLAVFTADENNIRLDSTDVEEKYRKGLFGSLPDPKLVKTLLQIKKAREVENV